jgi:hypothetical protein
MDDRMTQVRKSNGTEVRDNVRRHVSAILFCSAG